MIQIISPKNQIIKKELDPLYHVMDHMPSGNFKNKNTLKDLFNNNGLDSSKTFFLFDHYLYFEPFRDNSLFTGFMFPVGCSKHYFNVLPNFTLSFENKTKFNCAMNKQRQQREVTSIWLANNFETSKFNYTKSWYPNTEKQKFLINSYKLNLENKDLDFNWVDYLSNPLNNYLKNTSNAEVFNNAIYPAIFADSAVSIVLEPITSEHGCMITEKYINAVYAGTIPLVDGYMIGEVLSKIGLKTFKDFIDYSYQFETNPIKRIIKMLDNNKQLLDNCAEVIQNKDVQQQLIENFQLIRNPKKLRKNVIFNLNSYESIQRYKELSVNINGEIIKFVNQVIEPRK
jgi:hypothetical protein